MKLNHLLSGAALLAGLLIAAPGWAQGPPPTGRHYGGFSGDSPNPGFGPMSTEAGVAPPAAPAPPPAPRHHARRHAHTAARHAKPAALTGDTANQLNQQELARIQSSAPPPPMPAPQPQQ